jgi:hypothetical protein
MEQIMNTEREAKAKIMAEIWETSNSISESNNLLQKRVYLLRMFKNISDILNLHFSVRIEKIKISKKIKEILISSTNTLNPVNTQITGIEIDNYRIPIEEYKKKDGFVFDIVVEKHIIGLNNITLQ